MGKKLYVGNLPFSATEDELRDLFERHGSVDSVKVIMDRDTGRPRGFAFVEMSEPSAATDAIRALDGTSMGGRALKVNEAQDKPRTGGGGGGGGFGRSGHAAALPASVIAANRVERATAETCFFIVFDSSVGVRRGPFATGGPRSTRRNDVKKPVRFAPRGASCSAQSVVAATRTARAFPAVRR